MTTDEYDALEKRVCAAHEIRGEIRELEMLLVELAGPEAKHLRLERHSASTMSTMPERTNHCIPIVPIETAVKHWADGKMKSLREKLEKL